MDPEHISIEDRVCQKPERAVPTNPEKINPRLYAAAESRQLSRIPAFLDGPRAARGRLTAPGALRRQPRFARRGALRAPRFRARTALRAVPGLGGLFGFTVVSSLLIWKHP